MKEFTLNGHAIKVLDCMIEDGEANCFEEGIDFSVDGEFVGALIGWSTECSVDELIELVELNFKSKIV